VQDLSGKEAVLRDLEKMTATLPKIEVGEVWGAGPFAIAEVVWSASKDGKEAKLHALHIVEYAGRKIAKSTLYANRRELESE
jgi:hypothetical protein